MYYILNQNEQIVAVDPQLLSHLEVDNADDFYKRLALKDISFKLFDDEVTISSKENVYTFPVKTSSLSGILGELTLVDIDSNAAVSSAASESESKDDEPITYFDKKESTDTEEKSSEDELLIFNDDDLFNLKEESDVQHEEPESTSPGKENKEEDELFELILPTDADNAIAEIEHAEDETTSKPEDLHTPIYIDIESISKKIGISTEDYNLFLNEYIDTAITLEEALQSNNQEEQTEALNKLSHLSNVLHLPFVNDLLNQIKNASDTERDSFIESFFSTLGRLSTAQFEEEKLPPASAEESKEEVQKEESAEERKPAIDLSDVKPIHFDFQLEEAAKDLSLPVELIEEFVNDFIVQAHEETEKMLAAYEKGDLETIQKIGHLLKGTSSNLRINPLSDTLYEIQFNEDIDRVPELVKNYWGHFLSLENQIKLISK